MVGPRSRCRADGRSNGALQLYVWRCRGMRRRCPAPRRGTRVVAETAARHRFSDRLVQIAGIGRPDRVFDLGEGLERALPDVVAVIELSCVVGVFVFSSEGSGSSTVLAICTDPPLPYGGSAVKKSRRGAKNKARHQRPKHPEAPEINRDHPCKRKEVLMTGTQVPPAAIPSSPDSGRPGWQLL